MNEEELEQWSKDNHPETKQNGIKVIIKWEFFWLVIQFIILIAAITGNYVATQSRLTNLEKTLDDHIKIHSNYLQKDVWELRNKFIDEKLDKIDSKLDHLLDQQRVDTDRDVRAQGIIK